MHIADRPTSISQMFLTIFLFADAEANDACEQALCECDKTASLCFAANEYNAEYYDYDKENMCTA